jgi:hypothetical protein
MRKKNKEKKTKAIHGYLCSSISWTLLRLFFLFVLASDPVSSAHSCHELKTSVVIVPRDLKSFLSFSVSQLVVLFKVSHEFAFECILFLLFTALIWCSCTSQFRIGFEVCDDVEG